MSAFKRTYIVQFWAGLPRGEPELAMEVDAYSQMGALLVAKQGMSPADAKRLSYQTAVEK